MGKMTPATGSGALWAGRCLGRQTGNFMSDNPSGSWSNQPPYSPSSDGGQDGSWFTGSGSQTGGEQNASWYPPAPYASSGQGQQNGSWFSGQGGGESGSGAEGGSPPVTTWVPLYGDAKGFAQFGRPRVTVS